MSALSLLLLLYSLLSSISLSVLSDIHSTISLCSSCTPVSSQTHLGICFLPCSILLQFPPPSPSSIAPIFVLFLFEMFFLSPRSLTLPHQFFWFLLFLSLPLTSIAHS